MLLYDGTCGFCTQCARWLERHLKRSSMMNLVASQSLSDLELHQLRLSRERVTETLCWSDRNRTEFGAVAVSRALLNTRGFWPILGVVMRTAPVSWGARYVYAKVAKNRFRLPGASASCANVR